MKRLVLFLIGAVLVVSLVSFVSAESNCTDSDGGKNYYTRGYVTGEDEEGYSYDNVAEVCLNVPSSHGDPISASDYLGEGYCENNSLKLDIYTCPNGCQDGVCLREETEEAEEEPEPETCATEIKIDFDKSIYYIGDHMQITIEILDSQGNHLPDYPFYGQMYDEGKDEWTSPGLERTGADGYFRAEAEAEEEGKGKAKAYIEQIGSCDSVETTFELEIRRKEPVPCGIGTCIPEEEEEPEEIPEQEIFYKCNGCELEGKCYPMGYRKDGNYCSEDYEFIEQLGAGVCDNNFECESNVCVSGECVGEGLLKKIIAWFKKLFGGEEEEPGLEMCSELLIEENIGDYEYIESLYGHKDAQVALYSEDGEQIEIVKCCVAGYRNQDGEEQGIGGIVCPYNNRMDVENSIRWLLAKEEPLSLGEYKGQEVVNSSNAIIWTAEAHIVAVGRDPYIDIPLPEEIADAYLEKYPNDFGEIVE